MRVIVTGGAGFIGGHLVEALCSSGHTVGVIDNLSTGKREHLPKDVDFAEIDVRNETGVHDFVCDFQPDCVAHLAAQMSVSRSVREPQFDAEVNIIGLINVLQAAVANNVKRVTFASTAGVYGNVTIPVREDASLNAYAPYAIGKWTGERYLNFFAREYGLSTIALRFANVYGPRQNPQGEAGVVAVFATRLLAGEQITINGDGKYDRDYIHVSDIVRANTLAITSEHSGFDVFNVSTAQAINVNRLADILIPICQQELSDRGIDKTIPSPLYGPARPGDLRSNLLSFDKIQDRFGWQPTVEIESGLKETVEYFADGLC